MKKLLIFVCVYFVCVIGYKIFGSTVEQTLTEQELYNKCIAEEKIKTEMDFLAAWQHVENMTEDEYAKTFYEQDVAVG